MLKPCNFFTLVNFNYFVFLFLSFFFQSFLFKSISETTCIFTTLPFGLFLPRTVVQVPTHPSSNNWLLAQFLSLIQILYIMESASIHSSCDFLVQHYEKMVQIKKERERQNLNQIDIGFRKKLKSVLCLVLITGKKDIVMSKAGH